jgi:hypothetical protein
MKNMNILALAMVAVALTGCGGTMPYKVNYHYEGPTPPPTCCATPAVVPTVVAPAVIAPPVIVNPAPAAPPVYHNPCPTNKAPVKTTMQRIFHLDPNYVSGLQDVGASELPPNSVPYERTEVNLGSFVDYQKLKKKGTVVGITKYVDANGHVVMVQTIQEPYDNEYVHANTVPPGMVLTSGNVGLVSIGNPGWNQSYVGWNGGRVRYGSAMGYTPVYAGRGQGVVYQPRGW